MKKKITLKKICKKMKIKNKISSLLILLLILGIQTGCRKTTNTSSESISSINQLPSVQQNTSSNESELEETLDNIEIPDVSEQIKKTTEKKSTYIKKQSEKLETSTENIVKVNTLDVIGSSLSNRVCRINVNCILQNPELPTGCEITALTTVLNYTGHNVSKTEMASKYLKKSDDYPDFWSVFIGDPFSINGFGCYAGPIVEAANNYLEDNKSKYKAYNVSGNEFETLLKYVEDNIPVVIWGTSSMAAPHATVKWNINGNVIQWIAPEHCLVLIGYDLNRGVAIMSDPQKGIVEYKLKTVKERYIALHSQAVLLKQIPETKPTEELLLSNESSTKDKDTNENNPSNNTDKSNNSDSSVDSSLETSTDNPNDEKVGSIPKEPSDIESSDTTESNSSSIADNTKENIKDNNETDTAQKS